MHVSGQQLQQVSGVAAILRYPMPDLDELEEIAAAHDEIDTDFGEVVDNHDPDQRIREDLQDMGL